MRIIYFTILLFSFASCDGSEGGKEAPISTVDSNIIGTTDTVPAMLYLDNTQEDSIPIALDSAGPLIEPEDTQYKKPSPL